MAAILYINSTYTSTPVLLCSYAHRRILVRLYYSTPVLLIMRITLKKGGVQMYSLDTTLASS